MKRLPPLVVVLALVLAVNACAGPAAIPTSAPQPTATTAPAPKPTSAAAATTVPPVGSTAGQLADLGQPIFAASCAQCHGAKGQGATAPAIIGSEASLGKYGNAQDLLSFIKVAMPLSAPGSLKPEEYVQVLVFLLVQNNFVQANTVLDPNKLASILLKK